MKVFKKLWKKLNRSENEKILDLMTILFIDLEIISVINDDVTHADHFRDFVTDDFLMCVPFRHSGIVHAFMTDIMIPFSRFSQGSIDIKTTCSCVTVAEQLHVGFAC